MKRFTKCARVGVFVWMCVIVTETQFANGKINLLAVDVFVETYINIWLLCHAFANVSYEFILRFRQNE